jgi:hypothetical protein
MLRPSRFAAGFVVAAGAGTLALVLWIPLDAVARFVAVAWIGATWIGALQAFARRARSRQACEVAIADDVISVRDGEGRWRCGRIVDGSFVAPWLTIVRWRPRGARFDRTVVVLPGMLSSEEFRQMRVMLRWARGTQRASKV